MGETRRARPEVLLPDLAVALAASRDMAARQT
jgi:hypothetical protein